jgi:hypothetical protein
MQSRPRPVLLALSGIVLAALELTAARPAVAALNQRFGKQRETKGWRPIVIVRRFGETASAPGNAVPARVRTPTPLPSPTSPPTPAAEIASPRATTPLTPIRVVGVRLPTPAPIHVAAGTAVTPTPVGPITVVGVHPVRQAGGPVRVTPGYETPGPQQRAPAFDHHAQGQQVRLTDAMIPGQGPMRTTTDISGYRDPLN